MVTTLDIGFLLATAVWGVVFTALALRAYAKKGAVQTLLWALAMLALLVVGATILLYDFAGLQLPHTSPTGMFVPGLLAAGVLAAAYRPRWGIYYGVYVLLMTLVFIAVRATGGPYTPALLTVHVPSGLIIIIVPAWMAVRGLRSLALSSVGGVLIAIGGMALAALSGGRPILPLEVVLVVLTPIVFFSTFLITLGFLLTGRWMGVE
jgi:hypothetical protein